MIVVGTVNAARACAIAELVDSLAAQPQVQRLSVDLTCTMIVERSAAAILDGVRAGVPAWIDVTTAGAFGRFHVDRPAA